MTNIKLTIENMTCGGCEAKIEKRLSKKEGVISVNANHLSGIVEVSFKEELISKKEIIDEIEKLYYTVIKNKDNHSNENLKVLSLFFILIAAYLIIKNTVGFNFIPTIDQNTSYGMLFIVGIITSLHCMAMCGGINISQCVGNKEDSSTNTIKDKLQPSFLYNLGRVISYTIIGGIVGAIGSVFSLTTFTQGLIQLVAGILILFMGLKMLNIFPNLNKIGLRMPKFVANLLYSNNRKRGPFVVGLLNGFMPCGPLQTMQLFALGTGSFFAGALSMFFFSIGTVPLMFGLGALSTFISKKSTKTMIKISAVIIMILGFNMASRGYVLAGIDINFNRDTTSTIYSSSKDESNTNSDSQIAITDGSVQEINSALTSSSSYPTITVKAGTPVKWTISAEKKYLNGCNNAISIPKFKINKDLNVGDTVIEFTPTEVGNFAYSCWMGMIRGKIKVVAPDNNSSNKSDTQNNVNNINTNTNIDNTSNISNDDDYVDTTGLPSCCGGF